MFNYAVFLMSRIIPEPAGFLICIRKMGSFNADIGDVVLILRSLSGNWKKGKWHGSCARRDIRRADGSILRFDRMLSLLSTKKIIPEVPAYLAR